MITRGLHSLTSIHRFAPSSFSRWLKGLTLSTTTKDSTLTGTESVEGATENDFSATDDLYRSESSKPTRRVSGKLRLLGLGKRCRGWSAALNSRYIGTSPRTAAAERSHPRPGLACL